MSPTLELTEKELVTTNVTPNRPVGKILVVDDELQLGTVLVEALQRYGYEATSCTSGSEALAELSKRDFDLLLTDLMMPEMDGITLLKAALQIDPHLIGIILTGQGTIQTAVDAMQVGAFDYVLKPFRLQNLLPILTRALNTRQLRLENLQLRETVAIHELTQTIAFTLDPQTVLSKLTEAALQQTEADEVSVLMPTDDGKEFYVAAARGPRQERLLGERIPFDRSIASWVARERTPIILNGEVHDDRFVALWPRPAIRSSVSVPMVVANKLVGVLNLNLTSGKRPFALGQMKALSILAGTAAAALESASLFMQVRTTEQKYRSIFENTIEGLFQTSSNGRLLTANPAFARILGYDSPEEAIATLTDVAHQLYVNSEDRAEAGRLQEAGAGVVGLEIEAYRKDGQKIWLSVNRRAIRNQDSEVLYLEGSIEDITERRHAEAERAQLTAEIEKQRQRVNNIVASVPGVVWEAWGKPDAVNQRIDFVSDYVEEMLGYSVQEWVSTPNFWLSIVHPDDKEEATRISNEGFANGKGSRLEFRWIAKDGREVWVESNSVVVVDEHGLPVGLRGVNTDIGERKRTEDELKKSEERYRDLVENAHDLIYEHDLKGNYTASNKAGERLTGYSLAESLKLSLLQTVAPDYLEKAKEMLRRKLAGENITAYDLVIIAKDGTRVPVEVSTRLLLRDGVPFGVQGIARDITERKRAEDELRESEERYRLLFDSNPQPMWVYDLATLDFLAVNESAVHHYGYSREDFLAMTIKDIRPEEDIPALRESVARSLKGVDEAGTWKHRKKDGTIIDVEITSHLLMFAGRRAELILANDITERSRLKAALSASEEQLRQSQKLEAIGQLAGGVAHDFNNLLTVIGGYSSILLNKLPSESPLRPSVEEIKKASDRAAGLTRQLLAFSRKQILQPKVLDLNIVVADLDKMVRRLIGEDIDLLTITTPDLGKVKADPGQIEQVLLNLIVNSRDAMPSGGKLTIETANAVLSADYAISHAAVGGPYVMLAVSDTGCGMDVELQRQVFEPFFTTKIAGKGTGLGLATVYGIVKQSDGHIWLYSEPGKGSSFKIYLPCIDEIVADQAGAAANLLVPKGTETLLLVEDEDQVRAIVQAILEQQGYNVLTAANGEEAQKLAKLHGPRIQLLMTDVVMPQMSGRELAEQLTSQLPQLKVLYMSGYTDDAIVRHGLLDSKLSFIQKPFDAATAARKVREVLDSPNP